MNDPNDWPDWKLLLAKGAILWCLGWGIIGLVVVIVALVAS